MNGNQECFAGSHILLALVSMVVVVAAGGLIPVCFILSLGHSNKVTSVTVVLILACMTTTGDILLTW